MIGGEDTCKERRRQSTEGEGKRSKGEQGKVMAGDERNQGGEDQEGDSVWKRKKRGIYRKDKERQGVNGFKGKGRIREV